ncbi:hypothetical protein ACIA8C_11730 [Nocardia sp. NPDC051321]|uniref:hypothetical protein n=1 Tax=Nocardia sp. NPDC051321 TaxID=3364323 RepID=UPI0037A40464
MIAIFGISEDEAVVRINARFVGQTLTGDDIIFHEEAGFWARDIMYGPESFWWNDEAAAKVIPLSALPQSIYRPGRDRVDPDEHRED